MDINEINKKIIEFKENTNSYFSLCESACPENYHDNQNDIFNRLLRFHNDENEYWDNLSEDIKEMSHELQVKVINIVSDIIPIIKSSPILDTADERDVAKCVKIIRSALRLKKYNSWETEILHDEGTVLGVNPPGQSENSPLHPTEASRVSHKCITKVEDIVQLMEVTPSNLPNGLNQKNPNLPQVYRPNTAFIMMPIDPKNPELEDIYEVYKDTFSLFGITAVRGDDIEHEDVITKRIIEEIKTSEFLVGDLTHERPSVYYEIGYAHCLNRRIMLYRKSGTVIHFDLAAYNCPEYDNMKSLKNLLSKRLEEATNKKPEK